MFRHGYDNYQMSVDRLVQGMRECGLGNVLGLDLCFNKLCEEEIIRESCKHLSSVHTN